MSTKGEKWRPDMEHKIIAEMLVRVENIYWQINIK